MERGSELLRWDDVGLSGDGSPSPGTEEQFRLMFEQAPAGMALIDAHGRWMRVNAALCRLTGRTEQSMLALNLPALLHEDSELQAGRLAAFLSGRSLEYRDELRLRRASGDIVWTTLHAARIQAGGSADAFAIVQLEDVTERRAAEAMLTARALQDPLTGMANRVMLMERLRQALDTYETRVAVLFIDLDRFKVVNDTHGHEVGDRVLVEVAHRIQSNLRSGDIAARLGGDEFIVLCTDVRSAADVTELVDRLLARVKEPIGANGQYVSVSASVGVVVPEGGARPPEDLLRQADLAMYRAKQLGRARMIMFDDHLERHLERRLRLELGLHEAFRSRQFEVWYQPLVDLRDGLVSGAEALVRWRHPARSSCRRATCWAGPCRRRSSRRCWPPSPPRWRACGRTAPGRRVGAMDTD
ncbi:MAG TPA: diguanylate cyclase, partial [Egibacteraceae bacterium]|nr:diguanylate cyclase [Egibacteraceae bacterium]